MREKPSIHPAVARDIPRPRHLSDREDEAHVASGVVVVAVEQLRSMLKEVVRAELASAPANDEAREILTREQTAELLQVHPKMVTRYVETRGLPGIKINARDWRFKRADVLGWLEAQGKVR